MREEWEYDVVWEGSMPLLPPRDSRPQIPMPVVREKRLYNRKVKDGTGNMGDSSDVEGPEEA